MESIVLFRGIIPFLVAILAPKESNLCTLQDTCLNHLSIWHLAGGEALLLKLSSGSGCTPPTGQTFSVVTVGRAQWEGPENEEGREIWSFFLLARTSSFKNEIVLKKVDGLAVRYSVSLTHFPDFLANSECVCFSRVVLPALPKKKK